MAMKGAPCHGFLDAVAPIQHRHAPDEVGAAYIRAGFPVIGRSLIEASLIVRPFTGSNRISSYGVSLKTTPQPIPLPQDKSPPPGAVP